MAADMHIHVFEGISEDDLAQFFSSTLGSKYFQVLPGYSNEDYTENFKKISNTPNVWVGEVSWLKAAITQDADTYIPDVVGDLSELIGEDLPVIDDEFIGKVKEILTTDKPHEFYATSPDDSIVKFLKEHKGKRVFTVSW